MSAVLVAMFNDHATAEGVRIRLVKDGFPTDRVELTSCQELGQVKLVPREGVGEKLTEYFHKLFHSGTHGSGAGKGSEEHREGQRIRPYQASKRARG